MLNRRHFLASTAAVLSTTRIARADWKGQYPELTLAVVPAENASGVSDRYAPFAAYLTKELGVPVKVRLQMTTWYRRSARGNFRSAFMGASYSAYLPERIERL
jgi:phosphonate transport system substrate-binding protein